MKKTFTFLAFCFILVASPAFSQYCMLPGRTPYSPLQPGITNFELNTINRSSGNSESASSVVVTTGMTTTLIAGQPYTVSISHSEDNQFFVGARNNLRIWVDLNNNFSYADPGETLLLKDLEPPATTYTAVITIPASTPSGTFALRATAKMSIDAGHTLPTSCDIPADPLGYHGEMEDYEIVVENSSGQSPASNFLLSSSVCVTSAVTVTNNSTGTPSPTFSWTSTPPGGVTFSPNNSATNPQISFTNPGSYTITCKATNTVSSNSSNKTISVSDCNFVGLNENSLSNIFIGPNPAADYLNIGLPADLSGSITISNCLGEVILKKQIATDRQGQTTVDLSGFNNGIYLVRIYGEDVSVTRSIIVNK